MNSNTDRTPLAGVGGALLPQHVVDDGPAVAPPDSNEPAAGAQLLLPDVPHCQPHVVCGPGVGGEEAGRRDGAVGGGRPPWDSGLIPNC